MCLYTELLFLRADALGLGKLEILVESNKAVGAVDGELLALGRWMRPAQCGQKARKCPMEEAVRGGIGYPRTQPVFLTQRYLISEPPER